MGDDYHIIADVRETDIEKVMKAKKCDSNNNFVHIKT